MTTTETQPTGSYPHPAAIHQLDLEAEADKLVAELSGHSRRTETLAREGGMSLVMMAMEAGTTVAEHSAPGAVTVHALRGHVTLTAAQATHDLRPGQVVLLQPSVRHDLRAEEQSVVVLTVGEGPLA